MSQCPSCQSEITITDQNYGTLLSCPKCQAVFFVGWDGQPEISAAAEENPAFAAAPIVESPLENWNTPQSDEFSPHADPAVTNENLANEAPGLVPVDFVEAAETSDPAPDFTQPLEPTGIPSRPMTADGAFDSIDQFSNQAQESLPLSYDVTIRGLDLPKQVQELREAIQDARFGWEVDQIIARIRLGELTIEKISPIKASILIQRVKYADLEIEWRQHVLN